MSGASIDELAQPRIGDSGEGACAHCGLPAPQPHRPDELTFCCHGCLGAYQIIHGWGLEDYYALRDRLAAGGAQPIESTSSVTDAAFAELDQIELLGDSVPRDVGDGLVASSCSIRGLHCGACAWLIERSAALVPGWHSARVRMSDHSVELTYDPQRTRLSDLARWLAKLGYRIGPLVGNARYEAAAAENRRLLVRIAVAAFCSMNAMWIAVALYAGHFSGIAVGHANLFRLVGSALGVVSVFGPGSLFLRGAWASLRTRTPHMDLPLSLALVVGAVAGMVGAITGRGEVFFDSITMLVFLLLVGRWVQYRQQRRAAESVRLLLTVSPQSAQLVTAEGAIRKVPTGDLVLGDVVRVDAGQNVPVDGHVVRGQSMLDRSLLTGESWPVSITAGDLVEAGTQNLQSPIEVLVSAAGAQSRVGRLMQLVEDAAANKAPMVQLADRIGGWFVCVVIALAMLTAVGWWSAGPSVAITHAVALLIVACPCALALATPMALAVNIGRAAQRRIWVRGADCFERLAQPGMIWFDKTGTLTVGRLQVKQWPGDDRQLALVASLEQASSHPIARALVQAARDRELLLMAAVEVDQRTGGGVSGVVDGQRVSVGSTSYLASIGIDVAAARQSEQAMAERAGSPIAYSIDRSPAQIVAVADVLRPDAAACVRALRDRGWQVGILSGDHPAVVRRVAAALAIPEELALGAVSPEEKLQKIELAGGPRPLVMVGDGVNDTAALAAADVGVAVRGGAETSLETAPVYLADGTLMGLPKLLHAAHNTVRLIRRTFAVSLAYNAIAVVLAMMGKVSPLTAAIIMPLSSITVLTMILTSSPFSEEST